MIIRLNLKQKRGIRQGFFMQVMPHKVPCKAFSMWKTFTYMHNRWQFLPPDIEAIEIPFGVYFICRNRAEQDHIFEYVENLWYNFLPSFKYTIHERTAKNIWLDGKDKIVDCLTRNINNNLQCHNPVVYVYHNYWLVPLWWDRRKHVNNKKYREAKVPICYYREKKKIHKGYRLKKDISGYKAGAMVAKDQITFIAWSVAIMCWSFNRNERIEDVYETVEHKWVYHDMKNALMLKLKPFQVCSKVIDEITHNITSDEERQDPLEYYEDREMELICQNITNMVMWT